VPFLAVTLLLAACGTDSGADADRPLVVATTSIWGDVVSHIVGDDADVEVLIPRGADSHDYEPTSREVALLQEADLVVANGLGLENGLVDVLESASTDGANILEVAPLVDPIPFAAHEHEDHEHEDEAHDHGDLDPHVWFDLTRVSIAAERIAEQLSEVDDSVDWVARAAEYSEELLQADEEAMSILEVVAEADRRMVTNHEALGYFADRFDFEVIGVVIPGGSTLADPSSSELAALVEEMQHEGVTTIFAETTSPTRLAEAVAAEVGEDVAVVELYTESLGDPGSGAETLIDLVVSNARFVADAVTG
jgi:zinc/manganese transport system substrate-binding protein